ncbi:hypothetical protein K505DRAFT_141972 [Melanomma pulvis-pyrius CBS 109.77]|uniref:Uncharacterized protein n=1 Tax=Melanomma pulvis-pyrius CBS 109.77 TaxID=1314802 RepID=A0A6A6XVT4_9PLEO|nr:hypothetical protein K505DRAFT_141972 [Melanomma pulvis-pyrius CBS 109.77]
MGRSDWAGVLDGRPDVPMLPFCNSAIQQCCSSARVWRGQQAAYAVICLQVRRRGLAGAPCWTGAVTGGHGLLEDGRGGRTGRPWAGEEAAGVGLLRLTTLGLGAAITRGARLLRPGPGIVTLCGRCVDAVRATCFVAKRRANGEAGGGV